MEHTTSPKIRTDGGNQQNNRSSLDRKECLFCGDQLHPEVRFCRHCGVESPFEIDTDSTAAADHTEPMESALTDTEYDERNSVVDSDRNNQSQSSTRESHPVSTVAERLQDGRSFETDAARELCELLSAPSADATQLENTLSRILDAAETQQVVIETVDSIGESPTSNRIESAHQELERIDGEFPEAVASVVGQLREEKQKLTEYRTERDEFRQETERIWKEVSRQTNTSIESDSSLSSLQKLTDKLQTGTLTLKASNETVQQIASEVEQSVRPVSPYSQTLLSGLKNTTGSETADVLRTTVSTLDEYDELQTALDHITVHDVRQQLDSLDTDLRPKDEPVYRHLADRVREMDAMVDRETVDDIQLYAIFQESRFYDRTLIPRLTRTTQSSDSVDVGQQLADIEARIEAIRAEYVSVRADHNHTIPNHFLELADSLQSRAQRFEGKQPRQAAGIVAATAELLGHIEQLYERNEYSVMLRRLRG